MKGDREIGGQLDQSKKSFWVTLFCLLTFSPILNFFIKLIIWKGGTWGFGLLLIPYIIPAFIPPIIILIRLFLKRSSGLIIPSIGLGYNSLILIVVLWASYSI